MRRIQIIVEGEADKKFFEDYYLHIFGEKAPKGIIIHHFDILLESLKMPNFTSGSTLNEVLRSLRILNEDNKITIFSLIGRKDLTIESMD